MFVVQGILLALLYRARTGEGQYVETSLFEAGVGLSVWQAAEYFGRDDVPGRMGSAHPFVAPYEALATRDEHIIVAATERFWPTFCEVLGRLDFITDPRFSTTAARVQNRPEMRRAVEGELRREDAASWLERLEKAGIPAAPILTYDRVYADPHVRARGMVIDGADGVPPLIGNPVRMSRTPAELRRRAPGLGADTEAVLQRFGFAPVEIAQLEQRGVLSPREKAHASREDR
jgi:crotonobetainyl-CoA:carnitine CoA-transferase CaiB-like acyl-CoA transferase